MAREFTNDKIVSEMTRDGLQEHNLTTGDINRVSKRFEEYSYSATGSTGEVFRKNRNADFQKGHSFQQKYYHRNFQKSLTREKEYAQREERYAEKIGNKESHMHRKHHLHIQQVHMENWADRRTIKVRSITNM